VEQGEGIWGSAPSRQQLYIELQPVRRGVGVGTIFVPTARRGVEEGAASTRPRDLGLRSESPR
jgi:hypothetical protein